jgi:hypothetical protein
MQHDVKHANPFLWHVLCASTAAMTNCNEFIITWRNRLVKSYNLTDYEHASVNWSEHSNEMHFIIHKPRICKTNQHEIGILFYPNLRSGV